MLVEPISTLIAAAVGAAGVAPAASRVQRAPLWRGVKEITLSCEGQVDERLCATALAEARRGAPYIIRRADGTGGVATLAIHLRLGTAGSARIVTIEGKRAVTADEAQGALRPRSTRPAPGEGIERTLARAFDALLPWRRATLGSQPYRQQ